MTCDCVQTLCSSERPALLVGAGPALPEQIKALAALCGPVIAADGGLNHVLAAGVRPDMAIGDGDSWALDDPRVADIPLYRIAEQDSTDFEKVLMRVNAPLCLGVGFLGGRVDHSLAAMSVLVRYHMRSIILIGAEDILFHCPPHLRIDLKAGTRVSLYPLAPVACGPSSGLEWPVDGLEMAPTAQIGTSNRALGPVSLSVENAGMLMILPANELKPAIEALSAAKSEGSGW